MFAKMELPKSCVNPTIWMSLFACCSVKSRKWVIMLVSLTVMTLLSKRTFPMLYRDPVAVINHADVNTPNPVCAVVTVCRQVRELNARGISVPFKKISQNDRHCIDKILYILYIFCIYIYFYIYSSIFFKEYCYLWSLLQTWFNFNPSMDK